MTRPTSGRKALICGISGQDGAYLGQLLLGKGYQVVGTSRDAQLATFANLSALGIKERIDLVSMAPTDFRSVYKVVAEHRPDEIFNLAGQTSVGLSFQQPVETLESIVTGTLNLLETIRMIGAPIRFYNACSSECFGDVGEDEVDEETPFRPRSPYAVAKAAAFWEVSNYREAYDLFACSGILSNHESPLRPPRFVTRKITAAAARIARGSREKLTLGDLRVRRDWGWAPEYVDAMWRMLQQEAPDDYLVATGQVNSLEDFVVEAFKAAGLDWKEHVDVDTTLYRPLEPRAGRANPAKAERMLGWKAASDMRAVIERMVRADLDALGTSPSRRAVNA